MEMFTKNHLFQLPENAIHDIRKFYNLEKPGRIEEAVDILEQWMQKQDHFLKKDFKRDYLERTIILCKGSIEKAKKQIDRLCTMKTLMPQYFSKINVKAELNYVLDVASVVFLPVVTTDFYRVLVIKVHNKPLSEKYLLGYIQYIMIQCEYLKAHDYFNGLIVMFDYQQTNIIDLVTNINPVMLQQFLSILIEGFGARMKGIYILTQSKVVDLFTKMLKQFLSQKISGRLCVVKTLEELYKVVPKDILPVEYGGKERPFDELVADWVELLSTEEHVKYMEMMNKAGTNESLRQSCHFNQEYMGMPGSFRNMTVD